MSSASKYLWPALTIAGGAALAGIGAASILAAAIRGRGRTRLQDNVVVITGGSRGLGLAMAEEFGRLGAKLVLAARDPRELNNAKHLLVERLGISPERIFTVPADLRSAEEAASMIRKATDHFGTIDVLINNAGIITVGPAECVTPETFHDVVETNLYGHVHCALAVLPQLIAQRKGTIVNIASIGGKVAVPHMIPYTAAKFGVVGFSQALHAEMKSKGIHVTTVCPWLMRTGSHRNAMFSGNAAREYQWFSLMATLPVVSVSARYAARRIVEAVLRKETELCISPQAAFAARFAGLLPSTTTQFMTLSNRFLPKADGGTKDVYKGHQVAQKELRPATKLGDLAIARYNEAG